jgi:hypothetical protein
LVRLQLPCVRDWTVVGFCAFIHYRKLLLLCLLQVVVVYIKPWQYAQNNNNQPAAAPAPAPAPAPAQGRRMLLQLLQELQGDSSSGSSAGWARKLLM